VWLRIAESRLCPNCYVSTEHWVLYGQTGRTVAEATFCPICYPDVKGVFEADPSHFQEEAFEPSRASTKAGTAIHMADAA